MIGKHTQGSWVLSEFTNQDGDPLYEFCQKDRYGGFIASIDTGLGSLHPDENLANAHLIAAAPLMLEALTAIQGKVADMINFCRVRDIPTRNPDGTALTYGEVADNVARWAIAKANGSPTPVKASQADGQLPDGVAPTTERE